MSLKRLTKTTKPSIRMVRIVRIASLWVEISTRDLQNIKPNCFPPDGDGRYVVE
jgi:hypothetical protein